MSVRIIRIGVRRQILQELECAARHRRIPTRAFIEQVVEGLVASYRLQTLPPSPEKTADEVRAQARARMHAYRERQKALNT